MHGETCNHDIPVRHELAVSYCLQALCIQEAEPSSKVVSHKGLVTQNLNNLLLDVFLCSFNVCLRLMSKILLCYIKCLVFVFF